MKFDVGRIGVPLHLQVAIGTQNDLGARRIGTGDGLKHAQSEICAYEADGRGVIAVPPLTESHQFVKPRFNRVPPSVRRLTDEHIDACAAQVEAQLKWCARDTDTRARKSD
jgi:hypothetical protein